MIDFLLGAILYIGLVAVLLFVLFIVLVICDYLLEAIINFIKGE